MKQLQNCLARMEQEGYAPSRRMEEPIFHEVKKDGKTVVEPCGRKIVFEGIEVIRYIKRMCFWVQVR